MPAKVKVRILAGRNLPVMDKSSDASDAFVEVKLGNTTYKTEVYRRSLNPFWNSEWFRFEVSDQELQDEPLQIRIMDYDTYSANDAIGKVYINLNPLLLNPGRSMNGWLPIYDTLHGIRGEINCMVKVNSFADNNRYRHSSCGVRFFFSDIPNGYKCDAILGFVDELLVNDDPEYQWIDKIRTPRASNEARQTLFTKLSGEVQRKLGLKAEIFGGNAVIGYQQSFDLEGGSGIVGRGIGTAVVLSRIGHQYDEIISPLSLTNPNAPYPYYNHSQHIDRSASQSFTLNNRGANSDRHLVHSVSADFFYEVPSNLFRKRQGSCVMSKTAMAGEQSDQSDEETFVSLHSDDDYEQTDVAINETDSHKNVSISMISSCSPTELSENRSKERPHNLKNSHHLLDYVANQSQKDDSILSSKRKSNSSIIGKLLPINPDSISHKLAVITRPATNMSALKLISKVTHRKASRIYGDQRVPVQQSSAVAEHTSPPPDEFERTGPSSLRQKSSASTSVDSSSTLSTSSAPVPSQTRRKKEKAQTGVSSNVEDILPIIEEKLDDDEFTVNPRTQVKGRIRLLSGSSARSARQFTRTKEIDLSADSEFALGTLSHETESLANDLDNDVDEPAGDALSSSTNDGKPSSFTNQNDSILSTSSPSTSTLMTDETIRARGHSMSAGPSAGPRPLSLQQSDPIDNNNQNKSSLLCRSDTNLVNSQLVGPDHTQTSDNSQHSHQQLNSIPSPIPTNGSSFINSVKVVKAQQRLLHNMIKHQNEGLVAHSMSKAKSAFIYPSRIHQSEYPFVTLKRFPDGLILCTGGVVTVHSVKLLDHIINDEESETRDIWWTEVRKEIRGHAKALNCNTILGYCEMSKVLGDVCVLSARGTAAVMKPLEQVSAPTSDANKKNRIGPLSHQPGTLKVPRTSTPPPSHSSMPPMHANNKTNEPSEEDEGNMLTSRHQLSRSESRNENNQDSSIDTNQIVNMSSVIDCSFCHTPLVCVESIGSLANCSLCNSSKVPDVLLLTIEPPSSLNIVSATNLVQARVCRAKRDSHGEVSAKEIGDALPFLEYELHRQMLSKLKFRGFNCLFNLSIDISIGENMLTGVATGTGCFVLGLPTPEIPRISAGKGIKASKLDEIKSLIALSAIRHRENLDLQQIELQLAKYREQVDYMNDLASSGNYDVRSKTSANNARKSVDGECDQSDAGIDPIPSQPNFPLDHIVPSKSISTFQPDLSGDNSSSWDMRISKPNRTSEEEAGHQSGGHKRAHPPSGHHHHHPNHHHGHNRHHNHHHRHHHHRKSPRFGSRAATPIGAAPAENLINMNGDDNNIVLEVDDNEDADIIALLIDSDIPEGYLVCNSETAPSINQGSITSINMFTQVTRVKLTGIDQFAQQFDWIIQALLVKQRRSLPCCLTNLNFVVDLPESHVVQITVTGCVLSLQSPPNSSNHQLPVTQDACGQSNTHKGVHKQNASSTSMSPTSLSASSKSSSSSPTSTTSSESGDHSSEASNSSHRSDSSSSSITSKSSGNGPRLMTVQPEPSTRSDHFSTRSATNGSCSTATTAKQSITKHLSKGNLAAALISAGKSTFGDRRSRNGSGKTVEQIELVDQSVEPTQHQIRATIKEDLNQSILGSKNVTKQPVRGLRAVFKKQQTYPGANSPVISGQDNMFEELMRSNQGAQTTTTSNQDNTSAQRRGTNLLSRVKQPLKDLGSNFNSGTAAIDPRSMTEANKASSSKFSLQNRQSSPTACNLPSTSKLPRSQLSMPSTSTSNHNQTCATNELSAHLTGTSHRPPNKLVGSLTINGTSGGHHHKCTATKSTNQSPRKVGEQRSLNSSIDITSLSHIPGAKDYHYLGNLTFSFVRETNSVRENGGLNGFIQSFLMEVFAIVRAHVAALGGNAFLSFRLQQSCIFYHSNKNQAQCLISVAGDAVQVATTTTLTTSPVRSSLS